jgi:hypothetical protein
VADLEEINNNVTKLIVHVENIKKDFEKAEKERSDSKNKFWGKIDAIKEDIISLRTELTTMKIKVGAIVIVLATGITAGVNWAFRQFK